MNTILQATCAWR